MHMFKRTLKWQVTVRRMQSVELSKRPRAFHVCCITRKTVLGEGRMEPKSHTWNIRKVKTRLFRFMIMNSRRMQALNTLLLLRAYLQWRKQCWLPITSQEHGTKLIWIKPTVALWKNHAYIVLSRFTTPRYTTLSADVALATPGNRIERHHKVQQGTRLLVYNERLPMCCFETEVGRG